MLAEHEKKWLEVYSLNMNLRPLDRHITLRLLIKEKIEEEPLSSFQVKDIRVLLYVISESIWQKDVLGVSLEELEAFAKKYGVI